MKQKEEQGEKENKEQKVQHSIDDWSRHMEQNTETLWSKNKREIEENREMKEVSRWREDAEVTDVNTHTRHKS